MDIKSRITLRAKKLGVLLRDARLSQRKSIQECADAIGVTKGAYKSYEEGFNSPSLPELETLVYYMDLPIGHFWGQQAISNDVPATEPLDLPRLVSLRHRMVGALLRQERMNASISMKAVSEQTGIPTRRLKSYELGERPISLPELEGILTVLGGKIETFFDKNGPIGQWINKQRALQAFLDLSPELQDFVCQPVNRPYLELARNLSDLSTERLRSIAEALLDITL
ncbi:MAG: helix-turn-helix transcriptional regulator [Anaerolineales bacterium]|nr:helix-turn-helix transcriptional regulator [Anaerolineales bacterium]